jgi:SAM-dependent methyltransferase
MSAIAPDWSKGYRTDVEYTFGLYPFLNPDTLLLSCVLQGFLPSTPILSGGKEDTRKLVYCELGCGQGLTLNLLAARDPGGQYYGIDYNPNQVAYARAFAKTAGLENAHFREESFEDLDRLDIPECDVIALHGIWTWISGPMRQHIVNFMRRKLKPGGICYISYNCTTGRNDMPLRELLVVGERTSTKTGTDRVADAVTFAKAVAESGAGYFNHHPVAKGRLDNLTVHKPQYVIHEYLNADWQPTFFSEVARSLAEAKLNYAAAVDMSWNRLDLVLPKEAIAFKNRLTNVEDVEFLKDLWNGTMFRKDIYIKGSKPLNQTEQEKLLAPLRFALTKPAKDTSLDFKAPIGSGQMSAAHFNAVLERLKQGPATGAELSAIAKANRTNLVNVLQLLHVSNQIGLCINKDAVQRISQSLTKFDQAVWEEVERGGEIYLVTQHGLGTGATLNNIDYLIWRATQLKVKDRALFTRDALRAVGRGILHEGKPILDDEPMLEFLKTKVKSFDETVEQLMTAGM